MIGKTNVNGTSDASGVGAVLSIDAPIGSTVTVSQGSFSKVLRKPIEISAYFSRYFYFIKPNNFGSWTIMATDGTNTTSEIISVTENKGYEVFLTYNYYLFRSGAGGIIPLSSGHESNSSISIETSGISTNYTSSSGYQIFCCNTNAIDLSEFSALCVEGLVTERQTSSQYGGVIAVASSIMVAADDLTYSKYVAKTPILTGQSVQTTILDISSIDISGYVGIRGGIKGTINAIYLRL